MPEKKKRRSYEPPAISSLGASFEQAFGETCTGNGIKAFPGTCQPTGIMAGGGNCINGLKATDGYCGDGNGPLLQCTVGKKA